MENCLCEKCPDRFKCYTAEKIFANPRYQGLYEAEMGLGKTKEQAIESVKKLIEKEEHGISELPNYDDIIDKYRKTREYTPQKWICEKDKFKDFYTRSNKDK
jgi:NCAIR mutase (PurE)-related protein